MKEITGQQRGLGLDGDGGRRRECSPMVTSQGGRGGASPSAAALYIAASASKPPRRHLLWRWHLPRRPVPRPRREAPVACLGSSATATRAPGTAAETPPPPQRVRALSTRPLTPSSSPLRALTPASPPLHPLLVLPSASHCATAQRGQPPGGGSCRRAVVQWGQTPATPVEEVTAAEGRHPTLPPVRSRRRW